MFWRKKNLLVHALVSSWNPVEIPFYNGNHHWDGQLESVPDNNKERYSVWKKLQHADYQSTWETHSWDMHTSLHAWWAQLVQSRFAERQSSYAWISSCMTTWVTSSCIFNLLLHITIWKMKKIWHEEDKWNIGCSPRKGKYHCMSPGSI